MYLKSCRILGVKVGSDQVVIKKAYRSLVKKYHPDISTEKNSTERFIQVRRAYLHLSNADSYQFYLNRQFRRSRPKVQYAHRPQRRKGNTEKQYNYRNREHIWEAPEYVIKLGTFLDKIYDYIFLIVGLTMAFSPPFYFYFDDDFEISETGWTPIIIPAIIGTLFMSGVFFNMLKHRHPFALKIRKAFRKWMKGR